MILGPAAMAHGDGGRSTNRVGHGGWSVNVVTYGVCG
jgi:hypothetical protein